MKKICIVGMGNMGEAISELLACTKLYQISECRRRDDANQKLIDCDLAIICVKPQSFKDFAETIHFDMKDKVVISIMAGISLERLEKNLGTKKLARVMPNLSLKVGYSVGGWAASSSLKGNDKDLVGEILECLGHHIYLKDEGQIDAITALTANGPAYFYYLTELLERSAKKLGFSSEDAVNLARDTFMGAAKVMRASNEDAATLRKRVTSKGGTTAASIKSLKDSKFADKFHNAVKAGQKRSKELNK